MPPFRECGAVHVKPKRLAFGMAGFYGFLRFKRPACLAKTVNSGYNIRWRSQRCPVSVKNSPGGARK